MPLIIHKRRKPPTYRQRRQLTLRYQKHILRFAQFHGINSHMPSTRIRAYGQFMVVTRTRPLIHLISRTTRIEIGFLSRHGWGLFLEQTGSLNAPSLLIFSDLSAVRWICMQTLLYLPITSFSVFLRWARRIKDNQHKLAISNSNDSMQSWLCGGVTWLWVGLPLQKMYLFRKWWCLFPSKVGQ